MKFTSLLLTVIVAVVLQVALARYTVGGKLVFDFVLVGVLYVALQSGSVAGMLAGTMGGLLQDVLAGGIVGIGGLAKSLVGFGAGVVGTHFVLARAHARTAIVIVATVVHRLIILVIYAAIDQRWSGIGWGAMLAEMIINGIGGLVAFQAASGLPGVMNRQRANRRSRFSRRRW